jgi:hypothetical protein
VCALSSTRTSERLRRQQWLATVVNLDRMNKIKRMKPKASASTTQTRTLE